MIKTILSIAVILSAIQSEPRAVAKFCINQVFHEKQFQKVIESNRARGCQNVVITPIPETRYFHAYSVEVLIGE